MQSSPQAQFKWIMVNQCHLSKFMILRPLTSKRAAEVAFQLLDILLFGAPAIFQRFTAHVITELKDLWPDLIMVHGKPRHPQSQGSVEHANGDIKDMLIAWMSHNNTQDWSIGLRFVENMKNSACHSGIKRTPYKAMFGCDPKVGLTSSCLPSEVTERLQTEDDLLALISEPTEDEVSAHTSPTSDTTASTNTTHPTPDPTASADPAQSPPVPTTSVDADQITPDQTPPADTSQPTPDPAAPAENCSVYTPNSPIPTAYNQSSHRQPTPMKSLHHSVRHHLQDASER
ncbi:KRAB-A domain-containing protein 2-like [Macrobrachium nipponense]|uniref:KRAB-A domain-containing protein 2-like n=1 Tax=Macrobrachium nipponense TaxID=159736 RepID=UPI0030C8859B